MKFTIALLVVFAFALGAQAQFGFPPGYLGSMFGGYTNGGGYGNNMYNRGGGGQAMQNWLNNLMSNYHNVGGHNRRVSDIHQAEDNGYHNIGSGRLFNSGGSAANGYGNYDNGASGYGNNFGSGGGGSMMV